LVQLVAWFREWKLLALGILVGAVMIISTVAAPWVAPYPPDDVDYEHRLEPPSAEHWFGTDDHGRDILSRVIWGGRVSISVGAASILLASIVGLPWGLSIGFIGGRYDTISGRIIDAFFSMPSLLLSLAMITILGRSEQAAIIAIAIGRIPVIARVARAPVIAEKEKDYVEASRALGLSEAYIMFRTVLPNVIGPLSVLISLQFAVAVMIEASLSFLGMSAQFPKPSWGNMISAGRLYLYEAPHYSIFPGVALALMVLSFNLIGDSLRDLFDPRRERN